MKKLLYTLFALIAIVACSESDVDNGGGQETPKQPEITLSTAAADFSTDGGSNVITFTSSEAWTAQVVNSRADEWCSIEPTSGPAGSAKITVTTTANDTPDDRTASIIIKAGTASKTINVSQKQKDALTVTSSKFEVSAEGGEVSIEVKTNIDFEYAIEESAADWVEYKATRALKTSNLVFDVKENDNTERREARIAITSGEFSEIVTIYQAGAEPSIILTENEFAVSSSSQTIAVEVKSNVDVTVELPTDADWIKENTTRALSTNTYYFDIEQNDGYDNRTAQIKFTNNENGIYEYVTVTQMQRDAIVVAKDSYTVDSEGDEIVIEVGHNIDFEVEVADDWISRKETRAFKTDKLTFAIAANKGYDNRESTIKFTSKDRGITQTVKVYQAQEDALIVSKKDIVVSDEGGDVEFVIQTNVEFTVSKPDVSWLREVTTRGLTSHTLRYEVEPNTSYDSREAKIVVNNRKDNTTETITITQAQKDAIVLAKDSYTVDSEGDEIVIEVGHNIDFDVEIADDWITRKDTRAFVTDKLTFVIAANRGYDNRESTIKFTSKDRGITQTVKVYQAQEDALIVSKKDIVVSDEGGDVEFVIQTNVDFTVSKPDVSWLREVTTRGLTSHTLRYEVDPNTSYDSREAKIVVTNTKDKTTETITITQAQKDAIVLAKSEYEFGIDGGALDFEIQTNVDITVTISDNAKSWIKQVETRALETKTLHFDIAACSAEEDREGTITIAGGNATQTIKVKQSGLKEVLEKEREALIAFYNATGGDNWTRNDNWCSDKPVREWYGIYCNRNGIVYNVRLLHNNLTGEIPESIGNLTYLEYLTLNYNKLTGSLPESIGNLTHLRDLSCCDNQLTGNIAPIISKLQNLTTLRLDNNRFEGELPDLAPSIINCSFENNGFTGGIPDSHIRIVEKNSEFEYGCEYNISGNNLSGDIPEAMVNHENWHAHWRDILPQNPGYGFNRVDIKAPKNVVKCFDDSLLDLGETYQSNKYTIIFRWDPECYWANLYVLPIYKLYQKYKENGLGLVCTTRLKYTSDKMAPLTSVYKDIKVFWEGEDNNPYSYNRYFFLFRIGSTPYFHIIDNSGNIVFYGSGEGGAECIPQYHANRDDIYDFVANLFGDEKYEAEKEYESTDYSKDGEVNILQTATKGDGIDIVLMGDAYSDRLIADGTYKQTMQTAMEKFFEVEPYKSFRDHFNVYAVTAVSKNEVYLEESSTAFGCRFGGGTQVSGLDAIAFQYGRNTIGEERMDDALFIVMMNSPRYAGTCYMYYPSSDDWGNGVAVAYFPVGTNDKALGQLIHHEAAGHGFAKLADEYFNKSGEMPENELQIRLRNEKYGWWKNVDFTSDPTKVKWSHFLTDSRYANEGLGVYEGAFTYSKGAYRPTENSIMRHNTGEFNAPSREAIYYRIHKLAYGADWEYDYEEFVKWDEKNRNKEQTRGVPYRLDIPEDFQPTHPPVVINKSWRDAK